MIEDITTERALPRSLEAEQAILGAILADSSVMAVAVPILREEDFSTDDHRRIYHAMLDLFLHSSEIDVLTLKEQLSTGAGQRISSAYLTSLMDAVPDVGNVEHYAKIVKEKSTLRRLIFAGRRAVEHGLAQEKGAEELLGEITGEIFSIADDSVREAFTPIGQVVKHNLEVIEQARNRQGMLSGLATGYTELDRMTSGFQATDLIILAARPSVGKTSLALNIAQHVALREGKAVGFFSLEMSKEQLGFRVLCSEADVDAKKVRDGYASKEAIGRLVLAQTKIAGAKFYVDDQGALSVPTMRAKAQRLKREAGLDVLIVDYLQLMAGHGRFDNRTQEVSQISRGLKLLAKELHVPIVALSQLSRQPESRKGDQKKPQLADLRDSGCLTGDTRILRSDTGEEVTIRDLVERRERDVPVWTLDETLRLVPGRMTRAFPSGTKAVFRLRLASGRTLRASANHPFLTLEGWRPLEKVAVGDRLATARRVPEPFRNVHWHASTSRRMIEDLHALLLRFGIVGRIKETRKGVYRPCFQLHVTGAENQRTFARDIGAFGERGERVKSVSKFLTSVAANTNVDTVPVEVWGSVRGAMRKRGVSTRALATRLGLAYNGTAFYQTAPSRRRMGAVAAVLEDPELQAISESDVFWDNIAGIDPLGEEPVFDGTVPGTHNFVANGVVAHNSIEQDADLVIFLYREELYDRNTERKGIADVIISKQRNGPTGEFPLVFLPDHMTFANYAGPAAAPGEPF
jgi:replicative DNA helicase